MLPMHPLFAIGLPHGADWLYLLIIMLVLFGGSKLPQLARGLGKSLGEFKKAKEEFEKEIHSASVVDETKPIDDKARAQVSAYGSAPAATPVNSVPVGDDGLTKKS
jgi:sec-independent protein translocase protein TatA